LSVPLDKGDRVSDPSSLPPPIGEKNELNWDWISIAYRPPNGKHYGWRSLQRHVARRCPEQDGLGRFAHDQRTGLFASQRFTSRIGQHARSAPPVPPPPCTVTCSAQ
jgi:hypothetical protein